MGKSLLRRKHELARAKRQVEILSETTHIPSFESKLQDNGMSHLKPTTIDVLQVNVGKMCNQVCKHCHVDAGPDRKEIMTKETMVQCLEAMMHPSIKVVDLTGGAPELNPNFRWFVKEISTLKKEIIVRCNLTIILSNPKFHDLPDFFREHKINVVSSLPAITARRTDAQRGDGVFDKSIQALQMLNKLGYGLPDSALKLDLVHNPTGAFMPGDQSDLENEFKRRLKNQYDIEFTDLFTITNIPVSRFLDYLLQSGNYEQYMEELANAFNPIAAQNVMCRSMISVGWDGYLYDCDFNQMLDLKIGDDSPLHIADFNLNHLEKRNIILNQHCYGCTAGAGSSCGGAVV